MTNQCKKEYSQCPKEVIDKCYAKQVPKQQLQTKVTNVPHHGFYHPKNVFPMISVRWWRKISRHLSLKDKQLQGPNLMSNLFGFLFVSGNSLWHLWAQAMFHQVKVAEEHRDPLCFFSGGRKENSTKSSKTTE